MHLWKVRVALMYMTKNVSIVYNTMCLVILSLLLQGIAEPNAEALANIIQGQGQGH